MCKVMVTDLWWLVSPEKEQWVHLNENIQRVLLAALSEVALLLTPCWERDVHVLVSWLQRGDTSRH